MQIMESSYREVGMQCIVMLGLRQQTTRNKGITEGNVQQIQCHDSDPDWSQSQTHTNNPSEDRFQYRPL